MDPGGLTHPFTTPVYSVRLEDTKDPDQTPQQLWQAPQDAMPLLVPRQATFALLMAAARLTTLRSRGSVM